MDDAAISPRPALIGCGDQPLPDAIPFLLGDESAHVTGIEPTVDGGRGAD